MRLEDMKKNIPETPEFIHMMIQGEVERQLQDTKVIEMQTRRMKKQKGVRVAAAAAVCILATTSAAYAGGKLYNIHLERQGTYSVTTSIQADGSAGEIALPEKIHDIDITADYIPEGMEWIDETHLEYPEHNRTGGFSFDSVLMDNDDLGKAVQDANVVEYEERTFGNYEGIYLKYHNLANGGSFDQQIYLLCPDEYRVMIIYIGDDVAKEDAVKVVENLSITENETVIETAGMYTWSELVSPEKETGAEITTAVADGDLHVYQIGDTLNLPAFGEDNSGDFMEEPISVRVDSVQVADDLQLLAGKKIPEEWEGATGADRKLVNNTLSYVKSGDGIDSLDEVVKTENTDQKLVYVTVTYTNDSDKEIDHMLYMGTITLMNHEDGKYQIYNPLEQPGEGYDYVFWDGAADTAEMTYFSVSEEYGDGGNYIASLKPGESIQVDMAWIVNENDLDQMYLDLNGEGSAYEFTDSVLNTGLVDIRQ